MSYQPLTWWDIKMYKCLTIWLHRHSKLIISHNETAAAQSCRRVGSVSRSPIWQPVTSSMLAGHFLCLSRWCPTSDAVLDFLQAPLICPRCCFIWSVSIVSWSRFPYESKHLGNGRSPSEQTVATPIILSTLTHSRTHIKQLSLTRSLTQT